MYNIYKIFYLIYSINILYVVHNNNIIIMRSPY